MDGPPGPGGVPPSGRPFRPPTGLLVVPFVVGVGFVLLVVAGTGHRIDALWLLLGVLVGVVLSVGFLVTSLATRHPRPASEARLTPYQEGLGKDPLANIHAVERQGRRHRRPCVNCGTPVKVGLMNCPSCGHQQLYACKGCKTQVRLDWTNCPECGRSLP